MEKAQGSGGTPAACATLVTGKITPINPPTRSSSASDSAPREAGGTVEDVDTGTEPLARDAGRPANMAKPPPFAKQVGHIGDARVSVAPTPALPRFRRGGCLLRSGGSSLPCKAGEG
ncbi:hypothetical protein GCM10022293_08460 [Azospirillum formosense]